MSDAIKWGILVAGISALIITILSMPYAVYLPDSISGVWESIQVIVSNTYDGLNSARGFINTFLTPTGRRVLSGLILYFFTKYFAKLTIKITAWTFHFLFK